jgi:hypothetical protein
MPDDYKVPGSPVEGYRRFYVGEKRHFAKWTRRKPPKWFTEGVKAQETE